MIGYVGEIEAPWLLEVIAERFDYSALNAMTEHSLIYGGAIRDTLAGVSLEGDLDIVTSPAALSAITRVLDSSSKWVRVTCEPRKSEKTVGIVSINRSNPYPQHMNIQSIVTYRTVTGATVQIVVSKPGVGDMEPLYDVVRNVDIVCCGLAMDREGRIFEILEGAHNDCQNRIIRFNEKIIETVSIDRLARRVSKLEKRGWKSEIDLSDIKRRHEEAKPKENTEVIEDPLSFIGIGQTEKLNALKVQWVKHSPAKNSISFSNSANPNIISGRILPLPRHGEQEDNEPEEVVRREDPSEEEYPCHDYRYYFRKRTQTQKKEQYMRAYDDSHLRVREYPMTPAKAKPTTVSCENVPRAYKNSPPYTHKNFGFFDNIPMSTNVLAIAKEITDNWTDDALTRDIRRDFAIWKQYCAHVNDTLCYMLGHGEDASGEFNIIAAHLKRITNIMAEVRPKWADEV